MGNAAERCGVCDCFWDPKTLEDNKASQRPALVKKVKPLLVDLESEFHKYADEDGKIKSTDLKSMWLEIAEKKHGKLTKEEKALIEDSSRIFVQKADIDNSGTIDFAEFSTYMLGDEREHEVLSRIRKELKQSGNSEDLTKLRNVVSKFTECDRNGDGFIDKEEIHQLITDLAVASGASHEMSPAESQPLLQKDSFFQTLMDEMEKSPDGRINLWDVIALALGRRKTPVEVLLYDISNGVSKRFSRVLLGRKFEAIYHSGVLAYGSEYWYGGDVFRTLPPNTELFGEPLKQSVTHLKPSEYNKELDIDLQSVHIGYTLCTIEEFHTFLTQEVMPKYTRENYDVLEHNCNHCANEIVKFLTGREIPEQVRRLPELVMNTPTARLLKPFLNKWLGGFGGAGDVSKGKAKFASEKKRAEISEAHHHDVHRMVLGGDVVEVFLSGNLSPNPDRSTTTVVATVTKKDGDKLEIKYFDPHSGKFNEASITTRDVHKDITAEHREDQAGAGASGSTTPTGTSATAPRTTPFDTLQFEPRKEYPGMAGTAFSYGQTNGATTQSSLGSMGLDTTMPVGGLGTSQFGLNGPASLPPLGSTRPLGGLGLDDTLPVGGMNKSPYGGLGNSQYGGLSTSQTGLGSSSQPIGLGSSTAPYGGRDMPTSGLGSSQFGLSGPRASPLDTFGTSGLSQPRDASKSGLGSTIPPYDTRGFGSSGLSQPFDSANRGSPLGADGFGTSGLSPPFASASRGSPLDTSGLGTSGLSQPFASASRGSPLDTHGFGTSNISQPFDSANPGGYSFAPSLFQPYDSATRAPASTLPADTRGVGTSGLAKPFDYSNTPMRRS